MDSPDPAGDRTPEASDNPTPYPGRAVAAGLGAALGVALILGVIIAFAEIRMSWMAIGAGFVVGWAVKVAGRSRGGVMYGVTGASLAVLASLLGNIFSIYIFNMKEFGRSIGKVLGMIPFNGAVEASMATFGFVEAIVLLCALVVGYATAASGTSSRAKVAGAAGSTA